MSVAPLTAVFRAGIRNTSRLRLVPVRTFSQDMAVERHWRQSATLMLVAPGPDNSASGQHDQDFEVLMLKRGGDSTFMANMYVYPGGVCDAADFHPGWADVFRDVVGGELPDLAGRRLGAHLGHRPHALAPRDRQWLCDRYPALGQDPREPLPPDVALRICAIRESFEESGVLLVARPDGLQEAPPAGGSDRLHTAAAGYRVPGDSEHQAWRKRVAAHPMAFQTLCRELGVFPNIWALYEWSNWLTPVLKAGVQPSAKPKRFDTIFYMCCLDRQPDGVRADDGETTEALWLSPRQWLRRRAQGEVTVAPPQVYELQRMTTVPDQPQLLTYIRQREPLGLDCWMPVVLLCEDGAMAVLPGDDIYPAHPDYEGEADFGRVDRPRRAVFWEGLRHHRGAMINAKILYACDFQLPFGQRSLPAETRRHLDSLL